MRVYNFSREEYALENLKNNRIKVATIDDLNDPFELLAAQQSDKEIRRVFHGFKGDMHESFGLVCFSEQWRSPVMWSHYADKHRGICLGFDVTDKYLIKVKYSDSRLAVEFDDTNLESISGELVQKLFSTKFKDWSYERENRMFINLSETDLESGHYFYQFCSDMELKEVILGSRCTSTINEITDILGTTKEPVTIMKSRLAFHSFSVVRNKKIPIKSTVPNN